MGFAFHSFLLSAFAAFYVFAAEPTVKPYPMPDYPRGELRVSVHEIKEGREKIPTGRLQYRFHYYDGSGPNATVLGELSVNLSADGRSVKWARVDAYVPRKGIGSMLYRQALEAEFFKKVTTIETTWTDDNASTFNQKRFEGLSEREAASLTPSAKMFGKLGWELAKVESGLDRLNAKYRRSPSPLICDFSVMAGAK